MTDSTFPAFAAVVLALPGWLFRSHGEYATFTHPTRRVVVTLARRGRDAGRLRISHTDHGRVTSTRLWDESRVHLLWVWLRDNEAPGVRMPNLMVRAA